MSYRYNADDVKMRLQSFRGPAGDSTAANEAAARADAAASAANNAATAANNAASKANGAAADIGAAKGEAQAAAETANAAADAANKAAQSANSATLSVNTAASSAQSAAAQAAAATESAITATQNANSAQAAAQQAASNAQTAAQNARDAANLTVQATGAAGKATEDALAAAGAANNAANRANTEAEAAAANTAALKDAHPLAVAATNAANTAATNAQNAADSANAAASTARDAAATAQTTAQAAADNANAAAEETRSVYYKKADAILDTSARAASHELHAQRDYPLGMTVYGQTTQAGEGDPSPENVRSIHGLDAASVRAGGANQISTPFKIGVHSASGYSPDNKIVISTEAMLFTAGEYTVSADGIDTCNLFINAMYDETHTTGAQDVILKKRTFTIDKGGLYNLQFNATDGSSLESLIGQINATAMINVGPVAMPYEPYCAATADLPLLPDGSPLMGDGTVDDTVENWVRSGCDKKGVLEGISTHIDGITQNDYQIVYLSLPGVAKGVNVYCNKFPARVVYGLNVAGIYSHNDNWVTLSISKSDLLSGDYGYDGTSSTSAAAAKAYLAANPLTVYYRSTDYTPDKDLRVCRVMRRWKRIDSYAGETISTEYISSTGGLDEGAQVVYKLATPEVYMTDPLSLLPPAALESETVTALASGESAVDYAHKTRHYIDSQIAAAVALALANN